MARLSSLGVVTLERALVALVAVVVAFGGVVAVDSPVRASHQGDPGRVAYTVTHRLDNGLFLYTEVHTMRPDGSDRRRISSGDGAVVKTEYDEYWGGYYNIYSWSADPTWSPDGSTLAFLHYSTADRVDVRAVDADGGNPRVLFSDWHATMINWSPDGRRIAYADGDGIWVANADGSAARLIAEPTLGLPPMMPGYPSTIIDVEWSPDGTKLAFIEDSGQGIVAGWRYLSVIDVDGTNRHTDICTGEEAGAMDWSPDGSTIACGPRFARPDLVQIVQTVRPDGSGLTVLTDGWGPSWSPAGDEILHPRGNAELWSYDVSSATSQQVASDFPGEDLEWQPRQGTFWDDEASVFQADIEWLAAEGITKGCNPPDNDKYCPTSHVTRGQMAAFLVRALGLTERLDDPFVDDDDSIFEADIEKLAAAGITKGCNPPDNTRFCPDHKVTREQMAAFLTRALRYVDDGGGDHFIDDDASIFEHDIDCLATAGVTKGCNPPVNDRFCPTSYVTRGQMAAFLHRALG